MSTANTQSLVFYFITQGKYTQFRAQLKKDYPAKYTWDPSMFPIPNQLKMV